MISKVRVQNFRKHEDTTVNFSNNTTTIVGPNGSGKTSIVEAIYIALRGKSWRSNFLDIINTQNKDGWWRVDVDFSDNTRRTVRFIDSKKSFQIGDQTYSRLPGKLRYPVILFEPGDLQLLYGSPARRREFFDRFIFQLDRDHENNIKRFNKVLLQRNNILRTKEGLDNLFVWDIQFSDLAEKIISSRIDWIDKVNQKLTKYYRNISDNEDNISISYSSGHKTRNQILKQLEEDTLNNLNFTKAGPQSHDIKITINNKAAKTTASRGENRTIIFAILYSMIEISNSATKEKAVLIFDDIDSELDDDRRSRIHNNLFDNNLIATTTRSGSDPKNQLYFD